MNRSLIFASVTLTLLFMTSQSTAQTRDEKVRADRESMKDAKEWHYDDLEQGIKVARNENKPLMVVLRCIP